MMLSQADVRRLPIPDNSIDLIFTDPPYAKESLPCYGWLAQEASRVLKPGGFVLAMAGGYMLDSVMNLMGQHLKFHWKFELFLSDVSTTIWPCGVIARSKPILSYVKGTGKPLHNVLGALIGGGNDKQYHTWGQDVASARYYIDCFSKVGDLVLDPFVGGGTTLVACELIGRRGIGLDTDPKALLTTQDRINNAGIMRQGLFEGMSV